MEKVRKIKGFSRNLSLKLSASFFMYWLMLLVVFCCSCTKGTENIRLEKGMVISESVTVAEDTFYINSSLDLSEPALTIKGNDITIDFQGAIIKGSNDVYYPNEIYGKGIVVYGNNIKIKNLKIHGYQFGLFADGVNGIEITDSEFSYNIRCNNISDDEIDSCLLPVQPKNSNPFSEAAVKFNSSKNIIFKNNIISNNQNGIFTSACENGKIYNNKIIYNSHTGFIDDGSSNLKIMHNFLDWNKKFGIRFSPKGKNNLIAYNSITHVPFNEPAKNIGFKNNHFPFNPPKTPDSLSTKFPPLADGQNTEEFPSPYKGEKYFLFNEWGLYNFQFPAIWLREINDDKYTFAIFGPEGNWKIVNGNGFVQTSRQSGSMPATIVATKAKNSEELLSLDLEFIGVEFIDQFGRKNLRGKTYKFGFKTPEE